MFNEKFENFKFFIFTTIYLGRFENCFIIQKKTHKQNCSFIENISTYLYKSLRYYNYRAFKSDVIYNHLFTFGYTTVYKINGDVLPPYFSENHHGLAKEDSF